MKDFIYLPKTRKEAKAQGLRYYFTGGFCKNMHIDIRLTSTFKCRSCNRAWARKKLATDPIHKKKQNEASRKRNNERYHNDPEYRKKVALQGVDRGRKNLERYHCDPEYRIRVKSIQKRSRSNPEVKKKAAESARLRRARKIEDGDQKFIVTDMWRTLLKRSVRAGYTKIHSTAKTLGYTPEDLREHLEAGFKDGMSWENYGRNGWSIDHIRPISSFPLDTHPSVVHALDNLQPMWHIDNILKANKWDGHQ